MKEQGMRITGGSIVATDAPRIYRPGSTSTGLLVFVPGAMFRCCLA